MDTRVAATAGMGRSERARLLIAQVMGGLPKDPSVEEIAAWRKLPATATTSRRHPAATRRRKKKIFANHLPRSCRRG